LGYHLTFGSGRLRKVIDEDIEKIEVFLAHSFPDIVASFTAPVIMLVLMFVFDWRFGLASLLTVIAALAMQMMMFGAAGPDLMTKMQKSMADMTGASVEYVRGMPILKAFGRTASSFKQLKDSIKGYTQFMLTYTLKWENYTAAYQTITNNAYLFILPVGILIGSNTGDYMTFAMTFIFYLLFAPSMAAVLNKLMYVVSSSMRISGGVANLDAMMALPELSEIESVTHSNANDVTFENVSFSYTEHDSEALTSVDFTAKAGEVTAIVGPSGSGKRTTAHLIPRFWDVSDGAVKIGGVDIRSLPEEELMRRVSFVFQDVYLFGQSIRENIRMGRPDATDAEIEKAARAAQCNDFIMKLPKAYETVIGEDGVHLSGGERQRIAIARAIVQNAPILVLDEATAFADPENERLIQQALSELIKDKTVIMIAHRLGTVRNANKLVVMENGKVAEMGTHAALSETDGLYQRMWNSYTSAISWKLTDREGAIVNG
jgi:ATP-binding cassette subfamily B protein